jgi:hypothetical protein
MTEIGVSCTKKSYDCGAGEPIHAGADDTEKGGAFCDTKGEPGFNSADAVCWEVRE